MSTKTKGVIAILGASLMWAIEAHLLKLADNAGAHYLETFTFRAIGVAVTALVYVLMTRPAKLRITRPQFLLILYIALAGTMVADLLYVYALGEIPVINAVLIGHMQPIWVVLVGYFVLREDKLTRHDYLGIGIMIVAALLVATKTPANLRALKLGSLGDLLVLIATVAWATTGIVMRKYLRQLDAGVLAFYRFAIASAVFLAYVLTASHLALSSVYQILVGVVVGIGFILYYEGLKRIKAAQVSALELSTPLFAVLLSFLIPTERIAVMQLFGVVMLIVGVHFLSRKEEVYF
ncbi:MAG: DMT family transporter [Sedimentisphaerales bacterium]|nr:DMT family transporter [Sedimentisphaerales bacterium]